MIEAQEALNEIVAIASELEAIQDRLEQVKKVIDAQGWGFGYTFEVNVLGGLSMMLNGQYRPSAGLLEFVERIENGEYEVDESDDEEIEEDSNEDTTN